MRRLTFLLFMCAGCLPQKPPAPPPLPLPLGVPSPPTTVIDMAVPIDATVSDLALPIPPPPPLPVPSPSPSPPPPPGPPPVGPPNIAAIGVRLVKSFYGATTVSFGVPLAPGVLADVATVGVTAADGRPIAANVTEALADYNANGDRRGVRAMRVQFSAIEMPGDTLDVTIQFNGIPSMAFAPVLFSSAGVSVDSSAVVDTTVRTIVAVDGGAAFVEAPHVTKTLFTGREPYVLAIFPDGYLAQTGILGQQVTTAEVAKSPQAGLKYLSDAMIQFGLSAMYVEPYALNPDLVLDPVSNYEAWLYDRCASFLTAYIHSGDVRFLRHAYQTCSYYAGKITLTGSDAGNFSGKTPADNKYSHLRGVYAYYALTGDETALAAGKAMAELWRTEPFFVAPYRQGRIRGIDKLWTERLLGTSMEGLFYGHRFTGDKQYLKAFGEMFETAYRHITGNAAALATINPGANFPPQNCFIHNASQQAEGNTSQPWCSPWMSELGLDTLLRYQEQSGDNRVDEIIIALARFLRDVGSHYFSDCSHPYDTFLAPSMCDALGENRRQLVPLYGAGLAADGTRSVANNVDNEHCPDATALTAAALRALVRTGQYDKNPIPPFPTEGASILQLHHDFSSCAQRLFVNKTRPGTRDPRSYTLGQLAAHLADAATYVKNNNIGAPDHVISPLRELGWWFNMSMLQFGLLADANISISKLTPGLVPGGSATTTNCGTLTCIVVRARKLFGVPEQVGNGKTVEIKLPPPKHPDDDKIVDPAKK